MNINLNKSKPINGKAVKMIVNITVIVAPIFRIANNHFELLVLKIENNDTATIKCHALQQKNKKKQTKNQKTSVFV